MIQSAMLTLWNVIWRMMQFYVIGVVGHFQCSDIIPSGYPMSVWQIIFCRARRKNAHKSSHCQKTCNREKRAGTTHVGPLAICWNLPREVTIMSPEIKLNWDPFIVVFSLWKSIINYENRSGFKVCSPEQEASRFLGQELTLWSATISPTLKHVRQRDRREHLRISLYPPCTSDHGTFCCC